MSVANNDTESGLGWFFLHQHPEGVGLFARGRGGTPDARFLTRAALLQPSGKGVEVLGFPHPVGVVCGEDIG